MGVIAEQVKSNLPKAENPMDLLNKIMSREEATIAVPPVEAPKVVPEPVEAAPTVAPAVEEPAVTAPKVVEEPPSEPTKEAPPVVEPEPTGKEINFAKLRKSQEELKKQLEEKAKREKELEEELEAMKTGKVVPEFVAEKENRIKELEKYEKIYNLKASPEYKKRFIEPVQQIRQSIEGILQNYEAPEGLVDQLMSADPREVNKYLKENFDDLDAIEVKKHLREAKNILVAAKEAESEPQKILEELEQSHSQVVAQRLNTITTKAKSAWERSLTDIQKEGKIVELIPRADDSDFNKVYVEPITVKAATEYGKIVTMLAQHGLTELPDDLAYALANMTQRAHTSAVAHETRDRALTLVEELVENSKRKTRYERPQIGITHAPNGGAPNKEETRADRINSLLDAGRAYARQN